MSTIPSVSADTFDEEVLRSEGTTLVEFWAEWCGPCRAVTPVLEHIAAEEHPGFRIVKINSDDNPEVTERYRVLSIPTMKVFKGGEVVKTLVGAKPSAAIKAELAPYLV
ncbi:MAG TPA: thioredoxin [Diaminobutyricibacter sp.]|uniref:thioredoxin n=1 Tax=Leifsonia sp. McL0618 TaxID=3415677 RepID=UPI00338760AA